MPSEAPRSTAARSTAPRSNGSRVHAVGASAKRPLRAVPIITTDDPQRATALRFSETVRLVVALARRRQLRPPVFRSPPRLDGVDRSIRRRPNGSIVVAIRRTDRPLAAVQADVIEGVIAANQLGGAIADHFRRAAWQQLEHAAELPSRGAARASGERGAKGRGEGGNRSTGPARPVGRVA